MLNVPRYKVTKEDIFLKSYTKCLLNIFTDIAFYCFMWILLCQRMRILCIINTITCKLSHVHEQNVRICSRRCTSMWKIIHACVSAVSGIINILQVDFVQQPDHLIQDMYDYVL